MRCKVTAFFSIVQAFCKKCANFFKFAQHFDAKTGFSGTEKQKNHFLPGVLHFFVENVLTHSVLFGVTCVQDIPSTELDDLNRGVLVFL